MREYQFKCQKCGQVWYATDKDIKQSKKLSKDLRHAKTLKNVDNMGGLYRGEKYVRQSEQIAQMQVAQTDPERCPACGSRQVEVTEEQATISDGQQTTEKRGGNRFLIALAVLFMPYLGFFLVLIKKPFSRKVNRGVMIYCAIISCFVFAVMAQQFSSKDNQSEHNTPASNSSVISEVDTKDSDTISNSEEQNTIIEGFYRTQIEDSIKEMYNEGLNFAALNYLQTDPMECGLWVCTNTFTGKMTKKEHTYTARIGHNELYKDGQAMMFYLAVDGETLFWDEDGEDAFFEAVGK